MQDLATIAFYLGVIAYTIAGTLFFLDLARREGSPLAQSWAPRMLGLGALLHAAHVVTASLLSRVCPVESLHFALSLSALTLTGVYLLLRRRLRLHAIGAFVAPIALTFLVGAQFVSLDEGPAPQVPRMLLAIHILVNLLGEGLFLLAAVAGGFYIVQERQLKEKRTRWLTAKLPPLDALDRVVHRLLLAGFPLLTIGIVTGAVFAGRLHAGSAEVIRAVLAYATWVLVAAVLVLRVTAGWRGRRAAYGTIAGAVCVVLVILLYVLNPAVGDGL